MAVHWVRGFGPGRRVAALLDTSDKEVVSAMRQLLLVCSTSQRRMVVLLVDPGHLDKANRPSKQGLRIIAERPRSFRPRQGALSQLLFVASTWFWGGEEMEGV